MVETTPSKRVSKTGRTRIFYGYIISDPNLVTLSSLKPTLFPLLKRGKSRLVKREKGQLETKPIAEPTSSEYRKVDGNSEKGRLVKREGSASSNQFMK